MPSSSGTVPAGRRSHSARWAARPSARAADSGYGKTATAGVGAAERGRGAVGADHDGEHGLLRLALRDGAADRLRDLVGAGDDGRHEEHDQRVDARVGEQRRGARPRRSRPSPSRAGRPGSRVLASAGRSAASAARVSVGELGQREPGGLAGVGAEDAEPARVGDDADAAAARQRLASRGAPPRRPAPRACARAARRPGGRARRRPPPSRRARRCASWPPARRRRWCRPSARGSACAARRGGRAAPNLRGLPNDSR